MGVYAQQPGRLIGQVLGDVLVLAWAIGWAVVGLAVHHSVAALAAPARETASTADRLRGNLQDAAVQAGRLPGVGNDLRRPFDAASGSLGSLITSANDQVAGLERLATLLGWLAFGIPVAALLVWWLPRRIRFYRLARAAQVLVDSSADLDLFALRAMSTQPLHVLARVSDDPVAAWRAGDRSVIDRLAELELRRTGLRRPTSLR